VEREHPLSLLVARTLTLFTAKDDAARLSRLEAGFHPLADEVPLELGETGHDRAHELAEGKQQKEQQEDQHLGQSQSEDQTPSVFALINEVARHSSHLIAITATIDVCVAGPKRARAHRSSGSSGIAPTPALG
jgi:hypothetical protein